MLVGWNVVFVRFVILPGGVVSEADWREVLAEELTHVLFTLPEESTVLVLRLYWVSCVRRVAL